MLPAFSTPSFGMFLIVIIYSLSDNSKFRPNLTWFYLFFCLDE
jgi:hypothetical protein